MVFGRRTFPVRLTGGHVVGKLYAVGQPAESTHPSIPPGPRNYTDHRVENGATHGCMVASQSL